MSSRLTQLRGSAIAAHTLPLVVFTLFISLPGWFRIDNPELPWHQQAPEHWVYPLQTLFCGGLLLWFRRHYVLAPWHHLGQAAFFALVGIGIWVTPAWLHEQWATGSDSPEWWSWFGIVERREGFDPSLLAAWPAWEKAAIFMRFIRMVIVVPLVEELMWRGFLMRYVNAGDAPWQSVPFGTHSWKGFWVVTGMVTLIHNPEDYLAALVWGALTYLLAVRSRSLAACVFMHAVGNLILGLYALQTKQWGFW